MGAAADRRPLRSALGRRFLSRVILRNEFKDRVIRALASVSVAPVRALPVVVFKPDVHIGLKRLDRLVVVFPEGDAEELVQDCPVERSMKPLVLGVLTLVRRCSMPLSARYSSKGWFCVPQNSGPLSVRIAPTFRP